MATRTINDARNPKWSNKAQTQIDLEVDFDELDEIYVDFTAVQNDSEAHGVTLYNNAVNGDYGTIADYTPPSDQTPEQSMINLRNERNQLLEQTDYIEMPTKWATLSADEQTAWTTYRNALRDLPADYPNALQVWNDADDVQAYEWSNVTFPTKP